MPKEPVQITPAPEAERLAEDLIDRFHRHLQNEDEIRLVYLFTNKQRKRGGRVVLADTKKLSPVEVYLLNQSGVIETGEPAEDVAHYRILVSLIDWALLTDRQRAALIDHELRHIEARVSDDGELSFTLVAHEIGEFTEVLARHGPWKPELRTFCEEGAKQLALWAEGSRP